MADVYKKISEYNELAELDASGKMLVAQSDETYSVGADTMAEFVKGRITMDATPTQGSSNPVTSNGVYNAVSAVRTETQSAIQTVQSEVDALEVATTPDATLTIQGKAADAKAAGKAISNVQSALEAEDTFTNDVLSYVNYGYDTPFYQAEGSGSWHKKTGIDRNKQIIVLNRHATYSSLIRIKVSGAVEQAASNSQVDAWSTGLSLVTGHEYVATIKLLSGTSYKTDQESLYIPGVAIYRAGLHTGWSVPKRTNNIAKTTFTAENNTQYNIAIMLDPGEWNLTDAKFLLTLFDVTASRNVPDYYFDNDYLESRIKAILANNKNVGFHSDNLIFFTDPHVYRDGDITKTQNGLQAANLIKYVANRTNIRQIVCGGDLTNGNTMTPDQQITLLEQIRALYSPIWENLYMIIGNHEWNNPESSSEQEANMLTINQLYPLLLKDKEREYGDVEPTMGNYWIDNPIQKIRYFYLSCTSGGNISRNQLIWFAKQMELIPAEYTVFVLSHIGILTDIETGDPIYCGKFEEIASILDAAKAKSTYSYLYPETNEPITGDYTSLVDVIVAGVLCGHKHLDFSMYTEGGIPIIATACDRGPKSGSTDLIKVAREYGTIGEQLIDVVQIDVTNRKIYLTRIGGCTIGAEYDTETGLLYDTAIGTGTEYTGTEWTIYNPYKDREFVF